MTAVIRHLEARDTAALTACFRHCYGDTYPDPTFYDAGRLRERIEDGSLQSVVAEADSEIVGHMGITLRRPGARVAEAGNTVVDPRARGQRLVVRLSAELIALCQDVGLSGFIHYPTTAHAIMQKLAVDGGGIEAGILLDYVPGETEYRDFDGTADGSGHAVVAVYQPISKKDPAPHPPLFVPGRYRDLLRAIYDDLGVARDGAATEAAAGAGPSEARLVTQATRGLARLEVTRPGDDLAGRVERDLPGSLRVAHVDLPLDDRATPAAVEALRAQGFFFGALLPEYDGGDVLRLQRVHDPRFEALEARLQTPNARALLRKIQADRGSL